MDPARMPALIAAPVQAGTLKAALTEALTAILTEALTAILTEALTAAQIRR